MKRNLNKKVVAMLATIVVALGAAGLAFAYFTDSGNGTGTATVGTSTGWDVVKTGVADGSMYPGAGTSTVTFTATNNGSGYQAIDEANVSANVVSVNGNITEAGTEVDGCLATWFGVTSVTPTPPYDVNGRIDVAPGATASFAVVVHMDDSNTNQDVCKDATPDVHLQVG